MAVSDRRVVGRGKMLLFDVIKHQELCLFVPIVMFYTLSVWCYGRP